MSAPRDSLIIMAKRPVPGQVKTRLCPPLMPDRAAAFGAAFLHDTCAMAQSAAAAEVILACAPPPEEAWFADAFPSIPRISQRGADLGERLQNAVEEVCKRGSGSCVVIGSDSPDLPEAHLKTAFAALRAEGRRWDLVLGPAEDGGYYLIGLNRPEPRLFEEIAWSTDRVFAQTRARAQALGLRAFLLPSWPDVDTIEGLCLLRRRLAGASPEICPATRALFSTCDVSAYAGFCRNSSPL